VPLGTAQQALLVLGLVLRLVLAGLVPPALLLPVRRVLLAYCSFSFLFELRGAGSAQPCGPVAQ
jgi:hypothetical protein